MLLGQNLQTGQQVPQGALVARVPHRPPGRIEEGFEREEKFFHQNQAGRPNMSLAVPGHHRLGKPPALYPAPAGGLCEAAPAGLYKGLVFRHGGGVCKI
jgi:hypothetical protein